MQKLVALGRKAQGVLARPCAKPVAGLGKWREREREREREKERKREREKERKRERESVCDGKQCPERGVLGAF